MEKSPYSSRRREEKELHLREWTMRTQISRENTRSRRFSGSHIRSFREDARSFRSSITISSTASSPGYPFKEEIDPSTYSFTAALKALQARLGYCNSWDCYSPEGFALNSKWNEAEKYICNPLSGEVPLECLSAKTLSGRSFRNFTSRMTMSAPLVYPAHSRQNHIKSTSVAVQDDITHFPVTEDKTEGMTREMGTQSTPNEFSSSSPSPASTPSITERSLKRCEPEVGDSPNYNTKPKTEDRQVQAEETKEKEETTKGDGGKVETKKKADGQIRSCIGITVRGGCLSWMRKRQREKHKPRKTNIFHLNLKRC